MRRKLQGQGLHLCGDRHLEVQGATKALAQGRQGGDVSVADVAAVLTEVGGDSVRPRSDGDLGGSQGVGIGLATGVPKGRHVVDVHAKPERGHLDSRRLPGSSMGMAASSSGNWSAG